MKIIIEVDPKEIFDLLEIRRNELDKTDKEIEFLKMYRAITPEAQRIVLGALKAAYRQVCKLNFESR